MTQDRRDGRVAAITGGARGIGLEIAKQMAHAGYRIALLDINKTDAAHACEVLQSVGVMAKDYVCDITSPTETEVTTRSIIEQFGSLDVLVNCAGWGKNVPFVELGAEDTETIVKINFMGVIYATRSVLPSMITNGWGRIINISSDAARVGTPREAVYAGAKAAVIGFSKSLCAEVARSGITVNVICPGTTDTPLLHAVLTPEQIERRSASNPSGRIGQPDDVAGAVLYFASDAASFVNGQVLSVSGGMTRVG